VFKKEISEKKQTFKIQLIPVINEFGNVAADIPSALNDKDREEVFKSNVDLQYLYKFNNKFWHEILQFDERLKITQNGTTSSVSLQVLQKNNKMVM